MRREKSIIVVADTHFGLRNEIFFEPEVFSRFLSWVKRLEKGEVKPLKLGDWDGEKKEKVLKPPDMIILLGDFGMLLTDPSTYVLGPSPNFFPNLIARKYTCWETMTTS